MPRCRNRRRVVVQRWPAVPTAPNRTARSDQIGIGVVHHDDAVVAAEFEERSAQAPRDHFARRAGPLRVDPVKLISGMRGSSISASPIAFARCRSPG